MVLKRTDFFFCVARRQAARSGPLSADASRQLDVFRHDGHSLGVDSAQIGVLEQADQIGFACFLERHHRRTLKSQVGLEVLRDFPNEALEGQLPYEQFGAFLVTADLAEGHGARTISVGLFNAARGRSTLSRRFGGQLFSGRFTPSGLPSGLLGSRHDGIRVCSPFLLK